MSDPNRSKRVLDLCDQALLLAPRERSAFLDSECQGDTELKKSIESLLQAIDDSGSFLQVDEEIVEPSD